MKSKTQTISILGRPYSLVYSEKVVANGSDTNWGACSYREKEIQICSTLKKQIQAETLIHEISHLILKETGTQYLFTDKEKEIICEIAANAFRAYYEHNLKGKGE